MAKQDRPRTTPSGLPRTNPDRPKPKGNNLPRYQGPPPPPPKKK